MWQDAGLEFANKLGGDASELPRLYRDALSLHEQRMEGSWLRG